MSEKTNTRKRPLHPLEEIAVKAKAAGMTYGQYVAYIERGVDPHGKRLGLARNGQQVRQ
jgi:hypothetical protein